MGTSSKTENETETEVKEKLTISSYEETIKALTAQLQEQITANAASWRGSSINQNMEGKYAWKRGPPRSGEPSTKKLYSDGKQRPTIGALITHNGQSTHQQNV